MPSLLELKERYRNRIRYVGMADNEGLEFGLDAVTPVSFAFYRRCPANIRYVWLLPDDVVRNPEFQTWAQGKTVCCSYNQLRDQIAVFRGRL